MQKEDRHAAFYRACCESYATDPTGRTALESVLGKKIGMIEAEWKRWISKLRYHWGGIIAAQSKAHLGVYLAEDERGLTLADFESDSRAGRAGIRLDDVVVSVAAGGK